MGDDLMREPCTCCSTDEWYVGICQGWFDGSKNFVRNIEVAAALTLVRIGAYSKGFDDATQMREFCEPGGGADYFPMADSRPTADRLGW